MEQTRKRDTRKFYKDVRNLSNLPNLTTLACKINRATYYYQGGGTNIGKMAQYFKELLNPD